MEKMIIEKLRLLNEKFKIVLRITTSQEESPSYSQLKMIETSNRGKIL
jgi:hypothetical protein